MLKKIVITVVAVGVAALVTSQIPEFRRYLRIRNM
jgi:hypothetical protein